MNTPAHSANTESEWALVTGGSGRGGAAISRVLHARGLSVLVHHTPRSRDAARALQAELEAIRGASIRLWEADFASDGFAVPAWVPSLCIRVLICNASAYVAGGIGDSKRLAADWAIHVGSHAAILAALRPDAPRDAAPPSLRAVVAVSDIAVDRAPRGHVSYTVAKGALETMMLALANDWAPLVRFNVVQAGTLPFPGNWTDAERERNIQATIPLERIGSFDDLAGAVAFLALDASYVTGQVLAVDGGRSRHLY